MEFDSKRVGWVFSADVSEGLWVPRVQVIRSCVVWILTFVALCGNGVSKWGIAADWFIVMEEKKWKQANQLGPGWAKKAVIFLPWETEKS